MRLGFAIAAHLSADVLLLDEVFAVGDEGFQRKCFGKILEFKQRGGTIVFVSHDASAVERLCERAVLLRDGRVEFDGETREAIPLPRQLADEDPVEREAGLREWGSGEARVAALRLEDAEGERAEPAPVRRAVVVRLVFGRADRVAAAAARRWSCGSRTARCSARGVRPVPSSGGTARPGERLLRFELPRVPLAEGRFLLGFGLTDAPGGRVYHRLERAADSSSTPEAKCAARCGFEARWRLGEAERGVGSDELPDVSRLAALMEIAPDLQFKHYTVAEARLPCRGAGERLARVARRRRDLLRPRPPRLQRRAHGRGDRGGAAGDALVRPARVGRTRARRAA